MTIWQWQEYLKREFPYLHTILKGLAKNWSNFLDLNTGWLICCCKLHTTVGWQSHKKDLSKEKLVEFFLVWRLN